MQQFEIDWYKDLMKRYARGEDLSRDDMHRLNYLRGRYVREDMPHATDVHERWKIQFSHTPGVDIQHVSLTCALGAIVLFSRIFW